MSMATTRAPRPEPEATSLPQAERRRRAILAAAVRVIGEGGPDRVTHRRVAAAAGVPLGSTTYYFSSRDAIIREAFRHYMSEAGTWMSSLAAEFPRSTAESLVAGEFDPDPILRVHCTRFDNLWSENVEIPPNLCIQRYGGWLHS